MYFTPYLPLAAVVCLLTTIPRQQTQTATFARQLSVAPDTSRFGPNYATALPTSTPEQWEQDYTRYARFLTPEIRRTQAGLSLTHGGVQTWWCQPSASPHAQLDTTTRIDDAARLQGNWQSVANRLVVHIDSFSVTEQKFYRSVKVQELPGAMTLQISAQKLSLQATQPKPEKLTRNYALISQRYLLLYGMSRAAGAIAQVGLDAEGRLILHQCAVTERKIPGRYLTYQTAIRQSIYTHPQ